MIGPADLSGPARAVQSIYGDAIYDIKGNNPPSSFVFEDVVNIFPIQFFHSLIRNTNISKTKSWVSQYNRKYRSEYE